jgi:hypothetical protein
VTTVGLAHDYVAMGWSQSFRQWGWMRTRLTCLRSTMRVWSRTASMSEPKHRLRVRRNNPSPERVMSASFGGEDVVAQPGPVELV